MKIFKNKTAVISDLHLGLHQSNNIWHEISTNYAQWLKQTLINNDIKDIVILGDVIDNRNEVSVTTLHVLYGFFKLLEDFNIIIIPGNHDCYYSKRSDIHSLGTLKDWTNIEVIDKTLTVSFFNKTLTFCPWNTQLQDIPQSDIIFGHFEINTFKMNENHICEHGINALDLLDKSPLILSGHFHCIENRDYKTGKILYVGSPYEQSWSECGSIKGIHILNLHDSSIDFIANNKSPKHIKMRLSELIAIGKITDNIKTEFKGNILNFIIDVETEQKFIDTLITKLYTLNPLSIKTENVLIEQNIIRSDEELKFEGIDIKHDIIEFINNLEGVENKQKIINYLKDVYDKCEDIKK